jgi:hypothetical protein
VEHDLHGLQIAIVWDDPPDLIEVRVRASNGFFAGDVRAYAAPDALGALADAIEGFPRASTDLREFSLGGFGPSVAGGAVSLRFTCADRAGHAVVELRMESGEQADRPETVRFSFGVEPASLDRFVRELRQVVPHGGCAVLSAA